MNHSRIVLIRRLIICALIIGTLIGGWAYLFTLDFSHGKKPIFGVTFSQEYAAELGLNWQKTLLAITDGLKVRDFRLVAYWDKIEAKQDTFDFSDLDWQVNTVSARGGRIILVVGRRAPRWPECHDPSWIRTLAPLAVQEQQLGFIKKTVEHYRSNQSIVAWQIENEPLFGWFGNCPTPDKQFLSTEIQAVKKIDSRPVLVTDTGELSTWQSAASVGDVFGITLYRIVWNQYLGFWDYWFLPPAYYRFKADLTRYFHPQLQNIMVSELQMEPWTMNKRMTDLSYAQQLQSFDASRFEDNISYVTRAGFSPVYLWGAEYWYWLAEQGHPEIWQKATRLWQP